MWRLMALLLTMLVAASTLTDHFSSPPIEVLVIRTDQWLFCQDYGITIQIKATAPVAINKVTITAKFFPEGTLVPTIQSKAYDGFVLNTGQIWQAYAVFNYCPQRRLDPLILLEIAIYLPNETLTYNYYIGRVLPTTYEDLANYATSLEQKVKELTAQVEQLKQQIANLQMRLANLSTILAVAKTDNDRLATALAQVKAERDTLRAQLDQLQAQLNSVSQAKASLEAQLADARRQLEEMKTAYDKLSGRYTEAQKTIAELQTRLADLQRQYDELRRAEQQLRDSYYSLSAKYSELSGRYDELDKAYRQALQEKAVLQSRYSELNTGFTWAINIATALAVALLFVIALVATRKRQTPPTTPQTQIKTIVVKPEGVKEELVRWPTTRE